MFKNINRENNETLVKSFLINIKYTPLTCGFKTLVT